MCQFVLISYQSKINSQYSIRKTFFSFSSIMKNIVVFASPSRTALPVKLVCYLDQYLVFFVYLNLLLSPYNIFRNTYNLLNNQSCNHLLDQLECFKCFHMLLNCFYWLIEKVLSIDHKIRVFCSCSFKALSIK